MPEMREYTFKIKRFDPEKDKEPRWESFTIMMDPTERILDGLNRIKDTIDGTLTFRKSCAHGVCGSCAMKINGKNMLSCSVLVQDLPQHIEVEPLAALPVIKDLAVQMEVFFAKTDKVMPYLVNNDPPPERERLQSPEDQHKIVQAITCIMCGSCSTSCPSFWTDNEYLGPSALLKAARFILDTRDQATDERLEKVAQIEGLWRCHSIFNCVEACPKEIDITSHIAKLKRLAVKKKFTGTAR